MVIAKKSVHVSQLVPNIGQLPGVPANPRTIRDHKFQKLCKSIKDDPEMLEIRELVAIPFNGFYVVVGGNMRLEAIKELGHETATVKILDPATDPEKIKAFIIKDNVSYRENDWEMLANEWEQLQLNEWGMDMPFFFDSIEDMKLPTSVGKNIQTKEHTHILISFPKEKRETIQPIIDSFNEFDFITMEESKL